MDGSLNEFDDDNAKIGEVEDKGTHIILLSASEDEDNLTSDFNKCEYKLMNDNSDDQNMDESDIQYKYIDESGKLCDISVKLPNFCETNLKSVNAACVWTRPMVKSLINCYREFILDFRNPTKKQKDVWNNVAELMRQLGYDISGANCDRKWRNLKHTFKKYYYNKNKQTPTWEFYDDLLILFSEDCRNEFKGVHRKSRILPPLVSEKVGSCNCNTANGTDDKKSLKRVGNITPTTDGPPPPKWFSNYMIKFEKRQELMLQELQNTYESCLQIEQQKCQTLEAILSKLTNKE